MAPKSIHKSPALTLRNDFFLLFRHTTTVALHSRIQLSTVPHIIPVLRVSSKNATAGYGQGFPERASAVQPLPPEIERNIFPSLIHSIYNTICAARELEYSVQT
jgi:hypothetical protein